MTEAEATGKWCPFVRHEGDMGGTFNRGAVGNAINEHPDNQGAACNCIGSACMAWRTGSPRRFSALPGSRERPAHIPKTAVYVEREEIGEYVIPPYWEVPPEPYCGLAGAPTP